MIERIEFQRKLRRAGIGYLAGGAVVILLHLRPGLVSEERLGSDETAVATADESSDTGGDTVEGKKRFRTERQKRMAQLGIGMTFIVAFGLILVLPFDVFYVLLATGLTLSNTARAVVLLFNGFGYHLSLRHFRITPTSIHWEFILCGIILFGVAYLVGQAAWTGWRFLLQTRRQKDEKILDS